MKLFTLLFTLLCLSINAASQNWELKNSTTTEDIIDLYFQDESLGFFVTNTGKLYKTTDSGESWTLFFEDADFVELLIIPDSIYCFNYLNSSGPQRTVRSRSSIATANFVKDTLDYNVTQPEFFNNEIWTTQKINQQLGIDNEIEEYTIHGDHLSASNPTDIFYTSDFGNTWTNKQFTSSALSSQPYQSFYSGNDTLVAVTNYPTTIYKSIDNGSTWSFIQTEALYFFFLDTNHYLAYDLFGTTTNVYATQNGGNSFIAESLVDVPSGIYSLDHHFTTLYLYGSNGMLYKSANAGGLVSINSMEHAVTGVDVFPNPFTSTLSFSTQSKKPATIKLYSANGQLVLQENFIQHITLSTHGLNAGVYFYELADHRGGIVKGTVVRE